MAGILERRLSNFVDRHGELKRFTDALDAENCPILYIWGAPGRGKSMLLARMQMECRDRGLLERRFDWRSSAGEDYQTIMSRIADYCGSELFARYIEQRDTYRERDRKFALDLQSSGTTSVGTAATLDHSRIGIQAGTYIEHLTIGGDDRGVGVNLEERQFILTDRFAEGLQTLSESKRLAVFFDQTKTWFTEHLFRVIADGLCGSTVFVLFSEDKESMPVTDDYLVDIIELSPLDGPHVAEYMARKGVDLDEDERLEFANRLLAGGGEMQDIAMAIDSFLGSQAGASPNA